MENTKTLFKNEIDNLSVEYEIISPSYEEDKRKARIQEGINSVNEQLNLLNDKIDNLNGQIGNLTNQADKYDYGIAIASGLITGLIDSFLIGKWDFEGAKAISNMEINEKVMAAARKEGYTGKRLSGAIAKLEERFGLPGDNSWKGLDSRISANSHHLDDFSHHPTPLGLLFAILAQFTEQARYSNRDGEFIKVPISVNERKMLIGRTIPTKIFCGVINWFVNLVKTKENWEGHLISDIAGSEKTAGRGIGIPGPIISLLKEFSALPIINNTGFAEQLHKAFVNGIGTEKAQLDLGIFNNLFEGASSKVDFRTEKAIGHELKRQAIPVVINECLVRGFYFIRRLVIELREKEYLTQIDWKATLPLRNRTIIRMLTISTGTFMAVDLADATIRAAIETNGFNPATAGVFILRVNFVGVGRFSIAAISDVSMGLKKVKKENETVSLINQQLTLLNAKVFYMQADTWKAAEATERSICEAENEMQNALNRFVHSWQEIEDDLRKIIILLPDTDNNNPGLIDDISKIIEWG